MTGGRVSEASEPQFAVRAGRAGADSSGRRTIASDGAFRAAELVHVRAAEVLFRVLEVVRLAAEREPVDGPHAAEGDGVEVVDLQRQRLSHRRPSGDT